MLKTNYMSIFLKLSYQCLSNTEMRLHKW